MTAPQTSEALTHTSMRVLREHGEAGVHGGGLRECGGGGLHVVARRQRGREARAQGRQLRRAQH